MYDNRSGSLGRTTGINTVFTVAPLVIPLLSVLGNCTFEYCHAGSCIPLQNSRWQAIVDPFNLIIVLIMMCITEALAEIGQAPEPHASNDQGGKYKQIFRLRELHLLAFFILIYVGIEVTLGGKWKRTYAILCLT